MRPRLGLGGSGRKLRRALELEPGNALAFRPSASKRRFSDAGTKRSTRRTRPSSAIRWGPNYYNNLGLYCWQSDRDAEAESAFRKAIELDPAERAGTWRSGTVLLFQGKAEAALREMQQEKEEIWRLSGLPLAYHALGRRSESEVALEELKSKYGGEMAYQIAEVHAFRGEADLAFEWLERAYAQRDGGVTEIKGDRLFRTLIDDPRYKAFLKKMKLPE